VPTRLQPGLHGPGFFFGALKAIVRRLHTELKTVMAMSETREQIAKIGLVPADTGSPEELQSFVTSEIGRWARWWRNPAPRWINRGSRPQPLAF
jgi:hypothetical protein